MTTSRFARRKRKTSRVKTFGKKIAPMVVTGLGFVAFAMLVPSGTSEKIEARVFTQGLSINIDRSSPAYAALEDTLNEDIQTPTELAEARRINAIPARILMAGIPVGQVAAERVLTFNHREEKLLTQEHEQRLQNSQVLLRALASAFPVPKQGLAFEGDRRGSAIILSSGAGSTGNSGSSAMTNDSVDDSSVEGANASAYAGAGRTLSNGVFIGGSNVASSGFVGGSSKSISGRSSDSSSDEAAIAAATANGATVISAGRLIGGRLAKNNPPVKSISREDLAKLFLPFIRPFPGSGSPISAARVASIAPATSAASRVSQEQQVPPAGDNTNVHQITITGPVEFTGGVAITSSNDRVVIYRENDEEKLEPGAVWLRDAKYEIFVDQPVGRLVGELRSVSGDILGRGYYDLAQLPQVQANQYRIEKISITIGPIPHGISGQVSTAALASESNPKVRSLPVAHAHVQLGQLPFDTLSKKDGSFKEDSLIEGSTIIAHVDRPGHWGSLAFATTGSSLNLPMFTDQTMRAIMQASNEPNANAHASSFIWGRVTRGGRAVEGAHVDLMTADVHPVYFNSMMLPDPTLSATSANGLYAFFPVEPGSHAVQAADGRGVTEPSLFPTDEQTATQVNLELNVTKHSKIRVYDAFKTDWPLAAEVTSPGRKRGAMIPKTGEANVTFTGGDGLLILDTDSGQSYEHVRTTSTKTQKSIEVPMIQTLWLEQIRGALRMNSDVKAGTVVGFIRGVQAYQVSVDEQSTGPDTRILYFDARGQVTSTPYGESGGGFIVFNLPEGFRTVLVRPSNTTKSFAQAMLVESKVTNVLSKNF